MDRPNVYTLPGGIPFLPALADGLKQRFGDNLSNVLLLLPTRRAIRELGQYLVGQDGPALLPRMRPLADIDPDEPPFEPGYLTGLVDPLMPGAKRRFALARIMQTYHQNTTGEVLDPAEALALADPLLSILDDAAMEEARLIETDKLVEIKARAAAHFQNAADLYEILQSEWPKYLSEQGEMEPMARRVALLNALTELWTEKPPDHPVVIAGSTGTLKATARLIRCVAHMAQGLVILPGLDNRTPHATWENIKDDHPQKSLDNLIQTIGIGRGDVRDWTPLGRDTAKDARIRLIAESLVPVEDTSDWPRRIETLRSHYAGEDFFTDGAQGLSLIEARTQSDEALTIALIFREALTIDGQTAALITPDPALARRVKARLRRWGVEVDYSQGEPLEETALGGFLNAILDYAVDIEAPIHMAALFGHKLTALGQNRHAVETEWQVLEKTHFRGLRPDPEKYVEHELVRSLQNAFEPLDALSSHMNSASDWAKAIVTTAELIATTDETSGRARLWVEDSGEKAAAMLEELIAFGGTLGEMSVDGFRALLGKLMRGRVVRPRFGTHPRLQILGPLEARMLSADIIVLGGLNEGVWPAAPPKYPFLSRAMRQALGLSLPERRFGLAAHDFSMLAAHDRVILTRSERTEDGPAVASRWIWRLKTLLSGALSEPGMEEALATETPYLDWALALDKAGAEKPEPATRPNPKPPVTARWPKGRKLSITQVTKWIRDPYSIYGQYVLGLEPLKALDAEFGPAEFGSALHKAVEEFSKTFRARLPVNAAERLAQIMANQLIDHGLTPSELSREHVRLARIAEELVEIMQDRRAQGIEIAAIEEKGKVKLPDINFILTGKPDLIERAGSEYVITDYKTGAPDSANVVAAGFQPQLPLAALMIEQGAFGHLSPGHTRALRYVRLSGTGDGVVESYANKPQSRSGKTVPELVIDAEDIIRKLVVQFDDPDTGYSCQPRIQYSFDYSDYDHLARRDEWAQAGDGGEA